MKEKEVFCVNCDLHTHSIFSDGTDTPEELVEQGVALGLTALALTDHNSISGLPRFLAAGVGKNLTCVPGIEFSTEYRGRELHLVGLWLPQSAYSAAKELVALPDRWKEESNRDLAWNLTRGGYPVDYEALVAATPDGRVNRAHFAAALVSSGAVHSMDEAFQGILKPGGEYYHPPRRLDVFQVISFLEKVGAVSVLAHPWLNLKTPEELEEFLLQGKEWGLDGMEVCYSKFTPEQTQMAQQLAARFALMPSGGSDYHGGNKPGLFLGRGYGQLEVPAKFASAIEALARSRQGKRT